MIGLLQRVKQASVAVDDSVICRIDQGLLVLVGIEKTDTPSHADRLLERILGYRIFNDEQGRMNLSLRDIGGGLLLVPQFTLPADTRKGMRPGFSKAAPPGQGKELFDYLLSNAGKAYHKVQAGRFGAGMQVSLINDGPVTFWLNT